MPRTPAQVAAALLTAGVLQPQTSAAEFVDPLYYGTKGAVEKGNRSKRANDKRKKRKIANASKRRNRK